MALQVHYCLCILVGMTLVCIYLLDMPLFFFLPHLEKMPGFFVCLLVLFLSSDVHSSRK